jgi:hypothetical protein
VASAGDQATPVVAGATAADGASDAYRLARKIESGTAGSGPEGLRQLRV